MCDSIGGRRTEMVFQQHQKPQQQPQPQSQSQFQPQPQPQHRASRSAGSMDSRAHSDGGSSSTDGVEGCRVLSKNWLVGTRDVMIPFKAIRIVAIAITSFASFVPLWMLCHPEDVWFANTRPELWWWWSAATSAVVVTKDSIIAPAVAAAAVTAAAYNEVNEISVRRNLARKSDSLKDDDADSLFWNMSCECWSERRVCEFINNRGQTLFTQSWMPVSTTANTRTVKGLVVLLHGLNEHSGRYVKFAKQLNHQGYGVYAMDWIGHGGSDGLHGYVDSLDQVVLDTKLYLKQVMSEHLNVPMFIFGHSTGGAIALKYSLLVSDERNLSGIVLTSPAVRVRPSHPIVALFAPLFSILLPRYQFRGATRGGVAVSRDPLALMAKYSDPLVYTGPIRIRTGTEILKLGSFLRKNFEKITTPFLVLHGSGDKVTDPMGSRDLYEKASSKNKSIQIYDGLLHDLLFEIEKDAITEDIIQWLDSMLLSQRS